LKTIKESYWPFSPKKKKSNYIEKEYEQCPVCKKDLHEIAVGSFSLSRWVPDKNGRSSGHSELVQMYCNLDHLTVHMLESLEIVSYNPDFNLDSYMLKSLIIMSKGEV